VEDMLSKFKGLAVKMSI